MTRKFVTEIWETSDGQRFLIEEEAKRHEAWLHISKILDQEDLWRAYDEPSDHEIFAVLWAHRDEIVRILQA